MLVSAKQSEHWFWLTFGKLIFCLFMTAYKSNSIMNRCNWKRLIKNYTSNELVTTKVYIVQCIITVTEIYLVPLNWYKFTNFCKESDLLFPSKNSFSIVNTSLRKTTVLIQSFIKSFICKKCILRPQKPPGTCWLPYQPKKKEILQVEVPRK